MGKLIARELDELKWGLAGCLLFIGVNFRAEPNTDSEILTVLVTGTKLTLLGEENGWVQAEYNGQKGYVSSDYVTDQEPDTTTQETE